MKKILFLIPIALLLFAFCQSAAAETYTTGRAELYADSYTYYTSYCTYFKFNISGIPKGKIIDSAKLYMYSTDYVGVPPDKLDWWHLTSQTFQESDSASKLNSYGTDTYTQTSNPWTGKNQWKSVDLTDIFKADYDVGTKGYMVFKLRSSYETECGRFKGVFSYREMAGNSDNYIGWNERTSTSYYPYLVIEYRSGDVTPPEVAITSPTDGQIFPSDSTMVGLQVSTNEPGQCRYDTNDVGYSSMPSGQSLTASISDPTLFVGMILGISDGNTYTYYVSCKDEAGNENDSGNNAKVSFSVESGDTTPPTVTITSPTDGQIFPLGSVLTLGATTTESALCRYSANNTSYSAMPASQNFNKTTYSTSFSAFLIGLSQGEYTYYVSCKDEAGNENNAQISFTISGDSTPPMVFVTYSPPSPIPTDEDITLTASAIDFESEIIEVRIYLGSTISNITRVETCASSSCEYIKIGGYPAEGTHYYYAEADSGGGKRKTSTYSFTVAEPTPPQVTIFSPDPDGGDVFPSGTTAVSLGVSADRRVLCRYDTRDRAYSDMTLSFGGSYATSFLKLVPASEGNNIYYVSCIDEDGKENDSGNNAEVGFSVEVAPQPRLPDFSIPSAPPWPKFTWKPVELEIGVEVSFDSSESECDASPCSYLWNFDDGVPDESTVQNPSSIFGSEGEKNISLRLTDSLGRFCTAESDGFIVGGAAVIPLPKWKEIAPF